MVSLCLLPVLQAQILDNYRGCLFGDICIFNDQFIRANRIRRIQGDLSKKEEMRPIEKMNTVEIFSFNPQGKLTEHLRTFKTRAGEIDTSAESYGYNQLNDLIRKTRHTTGGYDATQYEYDEKGNIKAEKTLRGEWDNNAGKSRETIIKEERSGHEIVEDSIYRRTFLNPEGMPYRIRETTFGKSGVKMSEELRYVLTNKKDITHYQYDDYGHLIKMIHVSNVAGNLTTTYTIEYDGLGNPERAKVFKNGKLTSSHEYIYDPATFLLNARLIKDEEKGVIYITKFTYEYSR